MGFITQYVRGDDGDNRDDDCVYMCVCVCDFFLLHLKRRFFFINLN